jgi:hypothetical protein
MTAVTLVTHQPLVPSARAEVPSVRKVAVHLGYGTYIWFSVYCDCPRKLNELKTAITAFIRNISQADLQKVFVNECKLVQACIDTHGHHFRHLS